MIDPTRALPGRDAEMPVPARHDVLGTPLKPPFPDGLRDGGLRPRLLLGRRAHLLAGGRRLHDGRRLRRRLHAEPDLRGGLLGQHRPHRGRARRLRPRGHAYEDMLRLFWEGHDPTQGMRQGNDVGTQYRSAILYTSDAQREPPRCRATPTSASCLPPATAHHHGDRARRAVLLRRGLPPAVPGEEPERLLRPGRHRRDLPGRPNGQRLNLSPPALGVAGRRASRSRGRCRSRCPRSPPPGPRRSCGIRRL